jgi:hypothetical protein
MFANHGKEDGIYSLTTIEIAKAQNKDHQIYPKNIQKHQNWICIFNLLKTQQCYIKMKINHPSIQIGQSVGITITSSTLATHILKRQ